MSQRDPKGSEEFFERLDANAFKRGNNRIDQDDNCRLGLEAGIEATIEALKEMMVGEPIEARVSHYLSRYLPGEERTEYLIQTERGLRNLLKVEGHHGTDGEEVVVLAVRLS